VNAKMNFTLEKVVFKPHPTEGIRAGLQGCCSDFVIMSGLHTLLFKFKPFGLCKEADKTAKQLNMINSP
jgi:hypothetical protein